MIKLLIFGQFVKLHIEFAYWRRREIEVIRSFPNLSTFSLNLDGCCT